MHMQMMTRKFKMLFTYLIEHTVLKNGVLCNLGSGFPLISIASLEFILSCLLCLIRHYS